MATVSSTAPAVATDSDGNSRQQSEADRRIHHRQPAGELEWISKVRLKYGPTLSLLDLSPGGAQIEIEDHWLRLDSTVVVEIVGGASVVALPSRVVRWHVTDVGPSVRYRGALQFKRLLEFPEPSRRPPARGHAGNPVQAHARLVSALRRFCNPAVLGPRIVRPDGTARDSLSAIGTTMAALLATLNAPAGLRAGPTFTRGLSDLFTEIAEGVEKRESARELRVRLEQRLRRVIPAHSIRITHGSSAEVGQLGEAVYFDAPSVSGPRAPKILVEFARDSAPQEWQFQLLRASGHLVALIDDVEEHASPVEGPPVAASLPGGWNQLVVRFDDGRLLKGYCRDFLPARGHFQLCQTPTTTTEARTPVAIGHVRSVFFVRDFEGSVKYDDDRDVPVRPAHGRKVAVTFLDDEVLIGMTLNYGADGAGFFVTPCDPASNSLRIFVVNRAVRHVKFL